VSREHSKILAGIHSIFTSILLDPVVMEKLTFGVQCQKL